MTQSTISVEVGPTQDIPQESVQLESGRRAAKKTAGKGLASGVLLTCVTLGIGLVAVSLVQSFTTPEAIGRHLFMALAIILLAAAGPLSSFADPSRQP